MPTLALTGTEDRCIDSDIFQHMMYPEYFPVGVEVVLVQGAGHFPHQEHPAVINSMLLDWLGQHGP